METIYFELFRILSNIYVILILLFAANVIRVLIPIAKVLMELVELKIERQVEKKDL